MTHDDAHTSHNHGFELPESRQVVVGNSSRPWRVVAGVALCLGLTGIVAGLIVARRQSVSDEHLTSDALQREELRDGWKTLGAAAAEDAQANAAHSAAATTAPQNVVIVNVPAPSANAAPPNVTNITLPSGSGTTVNGVPNAGSNTGYAPNQSLPPLNFSPAAGYLPVEGYVPTPPAYSSAPPNDTQQPNNLPQTSYGTTNGGAPPLTRPVGNGSIPGSTPNPALPNNGLVGSTPVPGGPNAAVNSPTASPPVGTVPSTPGAQPGLP